MAKLSFDFLSLPVRVKFDVLGERLTLKEIMRLDSTMCQHQSRELWLTLLASKAFALSTSVELSKAVVLSWIIGKKLKVSSLVFNGSKSQFTPNRISAYLSMCGRSVREVYFADDNKPHIMTLVALYCKNLKVLSLSDLCVSYRLRDILVGCENIEQIWIKNTACSDEDIFADIVFPNLQMIHAKGLKYDKMCWGFPWHSTASSQTVKTVVLDECNVDTAGLYALVKNNAQLQAFGYKGSSESSLMQDVVTHLIAYTTKLLHLSLECNRLISDSTILTICETHLVLRTLNIQHCTSLTDISLQHIADHAGDRLVNLYTDIKAPNRPETESIHEIFARKCVRLNILNVNCGDIAMCSAVASLVEGCPQLQTLVVNKLSTICASSRRLVAMVRPELQIRVHDASTVYDILSLSTPELRM